MIVLSDSSPLITLAKIDQLDILPKLYGTVVITPAVYNEVVVGGAGRVGTLEISKVEWIKVEPQQLPTGPNALRERSGLGLGELSVIMLGRELEADVLLIDDLKARKLAREQGLAVLGCVGVLHDAFRMKLISDLPQVYRQLLASGAYVDRQLLENILKTLHLPPL